MAQMVKYLVQVGCNYPPDNTRAEPGDVVELPRAIARGLLQLGAVVPATERATSAPASPEQAPAVAETAEGGEH